MRGQPANARTDREDFEELRAIGDRLAFCIDRYRRLVENIDVIAPGVMKDSVEALSGQVGYVARRMQDLLVIMHERKESEHENAVAR